MLTALPAGQVLLMISLDVVGKTEFEFHSQNDHDGLIIIAVVSTVASICYPAPFMHFFR